MLRVLVSQRDRFRSRAQQLEEQAAQVGLTRRQMAVSSALWVWAQQAQEQAQQAGLRAETLCPSCRASATKAGHSR